MILELLKNVQVLPREHTDGDIAVVVPYWVEQRLRCFQTRYTWKMFINGNMYSRQKLFQEVDFVLTRTHMKAVKKS